MEKHLHCVKTVIGIMQQRYNTLYIKPVLFALLKYSSRTLPCVSLHTKQQSQGRGPNIREQTRMHKKEITNIANTCCQQIIAWFKERSLKNDKKCFALVHSDDDIKKALLLLLESYTKYLNHNDCVLFYAMVHKNIIEQGYAHSYLIETEIQNGRDVLLLTSFRIRNT